MPGSMLVLAVLLGAAAQGPGAQLTVCPAEPGATGCDFFGGAGLQGAVDAAPDGGKILVRRGVYHASAYREAPYQDFIVRAFVLVAGKSLTITGEDGAVLDGGKGVATSGIVAVDASVLRIENLALRGFRHADPEDDYYDGHGIFAIDSDVDVRNVAISGVQKMALTGRGDSQIDAVSISILGSHLGLWLEESAHLRLVNSVVADSESAGVAAYDDSTLKLYNSVFARNGDDGLYSEGRAAIYGTNLILVGNAPFGARAAGESHVNLRHSLLYENEAPSGAEGKGIVHLGDGVRDMDPRLGADFRPAAGSPALAAGDPDLRLTNGAPSHIGLPPREGR